MTIRLETPAVEGLPAVLDALRDWQRDGDPVQLHPGDLGWYWRFGAEQTAADLRTWTRDGTVLAVGLLDGPGLVRLTTAPEARQDAELAEQIADDFGDPDRGVLAAGEADVEAPDGALVRDALTARGWTLGEPWTPLTRDLAAPVEVPDVRVETVGPDTADAYAAIVRASFNGSTFTADRWRTTASGPYYSARSLLAYDGDAPAAAITVWSAGPGRPGLIEPLGVDPAHRGRGLGTAITLAGTAALRDLGASSAFVATESERIPAVATYKAAGYTAGTERLDLHRDAG
ncbi:GNAT family N-acetyltransferase [Glycomyces sp. NPDC047010]|uniref:GNAT family N-acetyltransferase n=1 Tax=Glycomyces sp. NPDC047010 TaxID=3155023 RepID=UPI0033C33A0E